MKNTLKYREEWLHGAVDLFRPWMSDRDAPIPKKVYVSCGFPKGRHGKGRAIGQCWPPQATHDGTTQMFVCPTLDEPVEVLGTLLHECIHAGCGNECGHKGEFKRVAMSLGLAGKMTATYVDKETPLHENMLRIAEHLGPYPHSGMKLIQKEKKKPSNWIRLVSPGDEKYTLVISKDSLKEKGFPADPWGEQMKPKKPWEWDEDGEDFDS